MRLAVSFLAVVVNTKMRLIAMPTILNRAVPFVLDTLTGKPVSVNGTANKCQWSVVKSKIYERK
jgi:hypothetical protein